MFSFSFVINTKFILELRCHFGCRILSPMFGLSSSFTSFFGCFCLFPERLMRAPSLMAALQVPLATRGQWPLCQTGQQAPRVTVARPPLPLFQPPGSEEGTSTGRRKQCTCQTTAWPGPRLPLDMLSVWWWVSGGWNLGDPSLQQEGQEHD